MQRAVGSRQQENSGQRAASSEKKSKPRLDWQEISINHTIEITDIVYPDDVENLKPVEIREQSKRKGIITRKIIADGKETINEAKFVA